MQYLALIILIIAIYLYYKLVFKPGQDGKNKIKQERKERAEREAAFREYPTAFTQDDYESFEATELMLTTEPQGL